MTSSFISLDVFDTALLRAVYEPTDIFRLIEQEVGENFYYKRVEAERKAYKVKRNYNLMDIYAFLPEFNPSKEIKMELNNCMANEVILEEYKKNPSQYVFISDMYLPSKVIAQMLEKCGYENPKVFVSCEEDARKSDGVLFEKVQKKIGKIIKHYGDNYVADIEGAKVAGIPEVSFMPALHNVEVSLPMINNTYIKKLLAMWDSRSAEEKIALYCTPLLTEFTKWILSNRKEGQKIFFLARDMYIPYKLATEALGAKDVYYIHASRRSVCEAILVGKDDFTKEKMTYVFSEEELEERKNRGTHELFEYFTKFNMKNGDLLADIGYAATIQYALNTLLGIDLQGMYMQTNNRVPKGVKTKRFLSKDVLPLGFMIEIVMESAEDCTEGYKDGEVITSPDNEDRKALSATFTDIILKIGKHLINYNISVADIEKMLIHLQFYPSDDIIDLFNRDIFVNRSRGESIIGFDVEKIKAGKLQECYQKSYAKDIFRKLLAKNKELKHLGKLLK